MFPSGYICAFKMKYEEYELKDNLQNVKHKMKHLSITKGKVCLLMSR